MSAKPGDNGYNPLYQLNKVQWVNQENAQELKSIDEIVTAENNGQLKIEKNQCCSQQASSKMGWWRIND